MTLRQVAERSGLSPSLISKIERGEVDPTVTTFWKLCNALEVPATLLLVDPMTRQQHIVRAQERRSFVFKEKRSEYIPIHASFDERVEIIEVRMEPGESIDRELITHEGEEIGYVLQGELSVVFPDREERLYPGDSIRFISSTPHRYANPGTDVSISLWVMIKRKMP
ncbi:hypothetical protein TR75_07450 [Hydrogenibacillus schlegelii]|nr:hypothetical protein TR75_07450 [Hydrogenibacillus schlegelii]